MKMITMSVRMVPMMPMASSCSWFGCSNPTAERVAETVRRSRLANRPEPDARPRSRHGDLDDGMIER
jgi:hypothetical protein